jgi:glutamate-1-semialdehyde 2,1-aminomutase
MYGHQSVNMLPEQFPQFFKRASGARLWDVDDNEYVDFMCAFGPNLLGYGYEPIERAAAAQRALGDVMTGPGEVMVGLAEAFVGMVAHADWAMFCKNGTDATTMALVIARAHTGRKTVLVAKGAYHGSAPWCTPRLAGILPADRANIASYIYNDPDSLENAFKANGGDVAAVFAAPFRHDAFCDQAEPDPEYARAARTLCDATGAVLVVDDVRAGFRLARDCSWSVVGVQPDLSTWGKSMANGYPISALLGSEKLRKAAGDIYVTGSYWFAAVAMAAAMETLRQIRETDYLEKITATGHYLRESIQSQATSYGFSLRQTGPVQLPQILFENDPDFRIGCTWAGECAAAGAYLHPYHNMFLSTAHGDKEISRALEATDAAFCKLRQKGPSAPPPLLEAYFRGIRPTL